MSRRLSCVVLLVASFAHADGYNPGDGVWALDVRDGKYYQSIIEEVGAARWLVSYNGYAAKYNQWVTANQLKPCPECPKKVVTPKVIFKVGDRVAARRNTQMIESTVLEVGDGQYLVNYKQYNTSAWVAEKDVQRIYKYMPSSDYNGKQALTETPDHKFKLDDEVYAFVQGKFTDCGVVSIPSADTLVVHYGGSRFNVATISLARRHARTLAEWAVIQQALAVQADYLRDVAAVGDFELYRACATQRCEVSDRVTAEKLQAQYAAVTAADAMLREKYPVLATLDDPLVNFTGDIAPADVVAAGAARDTTRTFIAETRIAQLADAEVTEPERTGLLATLVDGRGWQGPAFETIDEMRSQYRTSLDGFCAVAGLDPASFAAQTARVNASLDAYATKFDAALRSVPPQLNGKTLGSANERLAKTALASLRPGAKVLDVKSGNSGWDVKVNSLGVPVDRTHFFYVSFSMPGAKYCSVMELYTTENYAGHGKYSGGNPFYQRTSRQYACR